MVKIKMWGLWWKQMATVALSLLLLTVPYPSTALSSNGQSKAPDTYISVRALDSYGNAVQLSHAKEAARRYGRPVVVAVVQGTSNEPSNNSTETKPAESFLMVVSMGTAPILHPLQLPLQDADESDTQAPMLAMCFTGVKGDANWLLQQLQQHVAGVWERYGISSMSAPSIAHVVARLLGRFAGQPEKREWQSSLGLPGKRDEDDRQSSWSRPLGVQTMILSLADSQDNPGLLIVEPSGRILNPSVQTDTVSLGAMGRGSDKLQEQLARLLRGELEIGDDASSSWEYLPPTYDQCQDALIRVLLDEIATTNGANDGNNPSSSSSVGGEIMVETFSPESGKIKRQSFRYQNADTYAPI